MDPKLRRYLRELCTVQNDFTQTDLSAIRDAVPHLDLVAMRALRRAGFDIVRCEPEDGVAPIHNFWNHIPLPMTASALQTAAE